MLCIYVLRSQKGLARYHFVISCYDCFEKVLSSKFNYYGSLADYAIAMSNCETEVLLWVWLVHNICWNLNAGFTCLQQQEKTEFVKVFLYHFQFINWIAWGQAKVKAWGSWYVSNVSTFPNTFALVLDSNLHDFNETNPDWRCFQQNYHDVVSCVENKSSRNDMKILGDKLQKI